ncbi:MULTISPECIES: DUF3829 domain-containing protein [unclassified Chryseobacterium]|uniref:DUF3829 domain-containing protein n=1 Tax=unclassified Chryseobacterium TaxID=2593645 RepID=UPI000F4716C5|nr:DUF3829 domain-containing protein [Chryseobacterium sp. BIGb0232]MCS4304965.1 ElaB/YqjD/DUF883 family membrane-anchored ribosome-binding protein [Chryseobacterium sp. BIGb0232]ROS08219.1 uncharacterized protein DUF3829 [Chryseobacterium nakagawai]
MKKSLLIAGILSLGLSMTSCDKLEKIKEKLSQNGSNNNQTNPFSVNSGDENRDIVAFNNKVVKMDEAQTDFIKNFQESLMQMDEYVKSVTANPQHIGMSPIFTPTIMMWVNQDIKAPDALGKDYQVLVDKMKETASELEVLKKELETYKTAEDWKDDKGKKITEITEKSQKLIQENRKAANDLFSKLSPKADKAEIEVLKGHPLKDHIIQSKEVMELAQKIVDDSYDIKDLNTYKQKFTQEYQQMEKLYKRNIDEKIPSSEKHKEGSYMAFNNSVNDFLGKMRIVQRSLNENSAELNKDLDDLESEANTVLSRYNNFVD